MPRLRDKATVRFSFDGDEVFAEPGEPIASALAAAGHAIARSPKFHRPRGPACFRSACDGCLARVAGVPNVMTCRVAATEGLVVESQNTLGSRKLDLLRMTDWFFPEGMNHHELLAGVVGVQKVMQVFARRVAGLGKLPANAAASRPAARRALDVLVVGAGPAGLAAAASLTRRGRRVVVVDDALEAGGSALALANDAFGPLLERARAHAPAELHLGATVVGAFGEDLLVVTPEETFLAAPEHLVVATGAHDGVLPFSGNDLPGVMSARAAGFMLRHGALPGSRLVVVVSEGGGPFGEAYAAAVAGIAGVDVTCVEGEPVAVAGSSRARSVLVRRGDSEQELAADAVLVDAPRAPTYELAEQLGAELLHAPRGYVVRVDHGRVRDGVWAIGEVVGTPFEPAAIEEEAESVAARICR